MTLGGVDRLAVGITDSHGEPPSLRRILIDEYARHVGHADLIGEPVDGLTGRTRRADVSSGVPRKRPMQLLLGIGQT